MTFSFKSSLSAKYFCRPLSTGIIASLCITTPLLADTSKPINEIVVTAKSEQPISSTLQTSHIISAEQIQRSSAKDITDLLQQVSGINIASTGGRGSTTGVFLRGASASQTIVLIDGVRVGSATLGAAALNTYPLEAIKRIEVVKGPLSGIYGADAVGGVIQLFTYQEQIQEDGLSGSVELSVGSDDIREVSAGLSYSNNGNQFYLNVHDEQTDGIDSTSIEIGGNEDLDAYEQSSLSLGGHLELSEATSADISVLYSENTVDFDNTFGDDTGFFSDGKNLSAQIKLITKLNDTLSWSNSFGYNEDELVTPAFFSDITTERRSHNTELTWSYSDNQTLRVGLDYFEDDIETTSDFPVTDRDNKAAYINYNAKLGKFALLANLRYDDNSAYGSDSNGTLALSYALNDNIQAVLSHGTAFVAPSFNSLYFPNFGNPDLLPEESENTELSLRGQQAKFNWRVSLYRTEIDNLFSFNPETFLAANVGRAEYEGLEAELSTVLSGWDITASVNFLSAEDRDTGIELDDRAQQSLSISAFKVWEKFDFGVSFKGERKRFDLGGTELPSYALVDLSLGYQFNKAIKLTATVNNLFDKDYTTNLISSTERYLNEGSQARLKLQYRF